MPLKNTRLTCYAMLTLYYAVKRNAVHVKSPRGAVRRPKTLNQSAHALIRFQSLMPCFTPQLRTPPYKQASRQSKAKQNTKFSARFRAKKIISYHASTISLVARFFFHPTTPAQVNFKTVPPRTARAWTLGPPLPAFCTVILKSGALLFLLWPRPSPRLSGALMMTPPWG